MNRRRPKSFAQWAIGFVGTVITALIIYQLRIHKAENRLERDLSGIERHLHHNLIPQSPVAHQLSPEEALPVIHRLQGASGCRLAKHRPTILPFEPLMEPSGVQPG